MEVISIDNISWSDISVNQDIIENEKVILAYVIF